MKLAGCAGHSTGQLLMQLLKQSLRSVARCYFGSHVAVEMRYDHTCERVVADAACRNAEEYESERLAASMRADKAEASAMAAQHELIDVTKRYSPH